MRRCLFVDDSALIRKVAKRILNDADVLVSEAESAAEALSMCAADMPDLIIVDSILPDMDSPDFIRHVRAMPAAAATQILICLVEMDVPTIMRAKRAGAQGYMLKPFERAQLLHSVGSLTAASVAA
jgi:two-component system, chemotaxis family, chemotaxis protein CheY